MPALSNTEALEIARMSVTPADGLEERVDTMFFTAAIESSMRSAFFRNPRGSTQGQNVSSLLRGGRVGGRTI